MPQCVTPCLGVMSLGCVLVPKMTYYCVTGVRKAFLCGFMLQGMLPSSVL